MAAITICSDFGAPRNKVWHCFHCFPIYFPWSDGTRCHPSLTYSFSYLEPVFGRNDAKAETPVLWPPHVKSWLIGKDSDTGRDWEQEEKGTTEDEMAGWHHRLDGCEFKWNPGVGDGQGGLACCSSWGRKELDTIERLNWIELKPKASKGRNKD